MHRVVVTGVAGMLGIRVAELLRLLGHDVVGIDLVGRGDEVRRDDTDGEAGGRAGVTNGGGRATGSDNVVALDLADDVGEVLSELVEGADTIVHLAWQIPGRRSTRRSDSADEANRRSLERVLSAAGDGHVEHLVFVSSATVYGAWADNPVPLSEGARLRPNPGFAYAVGKAEAERTLAEWSIDHRSTAVAVLRPTVTVGGPEQPLYQALGAVRAPKGADGARPVQYLHVDDLASAVVLVVVERLAGIFNVAPDSGIREDVARDLAGGIAKVALPSRLARAVATWSWSLSRSGIPSEALPYATNPWVVAPDRLRAAGWNPELTSEEALVASDRRAHWDDLPPGRRQNYTMAAIAAGSLGLAGGVTAGALAWARRRR